MFEHRSTLAVKGVPSNIRRLHNLKRLFYCFLGSLRLDHKAAVRGTSLQSFTYLFASGYMLQYRWTHYSWTRFSAHTCRVSFVGTKGGRTTLTFPSEPPSDGCVASSKIQRSQQWARIHFV